MRSSSCICWQVYFEASPKCWVVGGFRTNGLAGTIQLVVKVGSKMAGLGCGLSETGSMLFSILTHDSTVLECFITRRLCVFTYWFKIRYTMLEYQQEGLEGMTTVSRSVWSPGSILALPQTAASDGVGQGGDGWLAEGDG